MPTTLIYEQILDEEGNLTFDEEGVAITKLVSKESTKEVVLKNLPTIIALGDLEQDPYPMIYNTTWVLVEGEKRTWKKYTKDGLEIAPC